MENIGEQIARELMSPRIQWINWLVLVAAVSVGAVFNAVFAWLAKSGEIKAISERLAEVVRQTEAITRSQEDIKQGLADSIWRDQRRWELEVDLYKNLLVSLGHQRKLNHVMRRTNPEDEAFAALVDEYIKLQDERRALFQHTRLLMPADKFEELKGILIRNMNDELFAQAPEDMETWQRMMDAEIAVLVDAENALVAHARQRLGTNI
jgi:hypothetical protein